MPKSMLLRCALLPAVALFLAPTTAPTLPATRPATAPAKPTIAVLPFLSSSDAKEKALAERMRFAVSQKLSTDANARAAGGAYNRIDNVQVDSVISALQIPFSADHPPEEAEVQQIIAALHTQYTITGKISGRALTLSLYDGDALSKSATIVIPPDTDSPKLAVEHILTDLTGTAFAHIREVEVDHSDPAVEARWAAAPNLVKDPGFEEAAASPGKTALNWQVLLHALHYPPPLISETEITPLGPGQDGLVWVVPTSAAGVQSVGRAAAGGAKAEDHCLMMRMSKNLAENNGLACESTWIPVEQGKKYRFSVRYHSTGPTARLFLKGFAFKPDQFGDKNDPEAVRREFYRAQILPRRANVGWDAIEMDFTPSTLQPTDPKIEWMRVDLYIYLAPGDVFFDDVVMKKIDP